MTPKRRCLRGGPKRGHAASVRSFFASLALLGCVDHVSLGEAPCPGCNAPATPSPANLPVVASPRPASTTAAGPRGNCDALAWPDPAGLAVLMAPLPPGAEAVVPFHVASVGGGTCRTTSRAEAPMSHCVLREPHDLVCPGGPSPFFTMDPSPAVDLPPGAQTVVYVRIHAPKKLEAAQLIAGRLELWLLDLAGNPDGSQRFVKARLATELPDGPSLWALATPPVTAVLPSGLVLAPGESAPLRLGADPRIPAAFDAATLHAGACLLTLTSPLANGAALPTATDFVVSASPDAAPCEATVELRVANGRVHRVPVVVVGHSPVSPLTEALTVTPTPKVVVLAVDDSASMAGLESRVKALGAALSARLRTEPAAAFFVAGLSNPTPRPWDAQDLPVASADSPRLEASLDVLARLATEARPALDGGPASPLDPPALELVLASNENDASPGDPLFYEAILRATGARVHAVIALESDLESGVPCGSAPAAGLRPAALAHKLGGDVSSLCKGAFDAVSSSVAEAPLPSVLLSTAPIPGSEVLIEGSGCAAVVTAGGSLRVAVEDAGCFAVGEAVSVTYSPR